MAPRFGLALASLFPAVIQKLRGHAPRPLAPVGRKKMNRTLGNFGEDVAAKLLLRSGYRILERNYRCAAGEIDIIAEHRGKIAFVEVKTRSPRAFLPPAEAVDQEKQRRIKNSAAVYLSGYRQASPHRYDIVAVYLDERDCVAKIELMQAAFV